METLRAAQCAKVAGCRELPLLGCRSRVGSTLGRTFELVKLDLHWVDLVGPGCPVDTLVSFAVVMSITTAVAFTCFVARPKSIAALAAAPRSKAVTITESGGPAGEIAHATATTI